MKLFLIVILTIAIVLVNTQEGNDEDNENDEETYPPQPYQYKYTVKDEEQELYIEKEEKKDDSNVVTGFYKWLMPNGRVMKVEYVADERDGFVPKISYEDSSPFTKDEENEVRKK
jgi:hypothetical protein